MFALALGDRNEPEHGHRIRELRGQGDVRKARMLSDEQGRRQLG
jgi:hypothetical protein